MTWDEAYKPVNGVMEVEDTEEVGDVWYDEEEDEADVEDVSNAAACTKKTLLAVKKSTMANTNVPARRGRGRGTVITSGGIFGQRRTL